jgi:PLP dependent protein
MSDPLASSAGAAALLSAPPAEVVAERLAGIRLRIERAGGDPAAVRIVAVTKGFDASAPGAAYAVGLRDIGENYPDELVSKALQVSTEAGPGSPGLVWHMLGAIQRRRVKTLAPVVGCWQTVSRTEEVSSIASHSPGAMVFVQVDTSGAAGRNGCTPQDAPRVVASAREAGLAVRGLMTVGPLGSPDEARPGFDLVASLALALGLDELSMGMSDDIEVAVSSGSTMLRVGRALFGPRAQALR